MHSVRKVVSVLLTTLFFSPDFLCHRNPGSCSNYTSDITDLGRYYYKDDLARLAAMGITHYSFSVSWTRVVPFGKAGSPISNEGLDYYEDVCKTALALGIEPVVTLFHWDTPANLVFEYGGFLNGTIIDDYNYYADIVFRRLGKYSKTFFTFNEPRVYCKLLGGEQALRTVPDHCYRQPIHRSAFRCVLRKVWPECHDRPISLVCQTHRLEETIPDRFTRVSTYNLLRAHGVAVQKYRDLVKDGSIPAGEIALKNDDSYPLPRDDSTSRYHDWRPVFTLILCYVITASDQDKLAAKRHFDFRVGIFSQPVYGDGEYPDTVRQTVPEQFLPQFTAAEKELIKSVLCSRDFSGVRPAKHCPYLLFQGLSRFL
jgi:beta-glucosidase